ncbi:hypothetical protein ACWD0A_34275, partial [Streptomyces sp. NPDC002867]
NSTHNSSGTSRSTRFVMHGSTNDHAIRNDVLASQAAAETDALIDDPADPATWRLPIEAYGPTAAQTRLINQARDMVIDDCMKEAGYPDWKPAPDLPPLGGKTLTDWRYGIHDAALAATRGYKPALEQQKAYDAAMQEGAVDESGASDSALRSCAAEADGPAPRADASSLAQQVGSDSFQAATKDPAVIAVFEKWSSCMKEKGYTYKHPLEPVDDPRFTDPYDISKEEIATATADIACKKQYDVARVWFNAEAGRQQKAIKANQAAFDTMRAEAKSAVSKANAVTARQ